MTDNPFEIPQYSMSIHAGFDADGALSYQCEYSCDEPDTMPPWLVGLGMIEALRCDYITQQTALDDAEGD